MPEPKCEKYIFKIILDILYVIALNSYSNKEYIFKLFNRIINWVLGK